jgi:hypothetical protein
MPYSLHTENNNLVKSIEALWYFHCPIFFLPQECYTFNTGNS